MASATSSHASPDPFDLGVHTPPNLARLARASQLRHSSPIASRPIGLTSAFRRPAATPPYQTLQCRRYGRSAAFAEQFSNSFLDFWKQALSDLNSAPAPTYSSVAAGRPASQPSGPHSTAAAAPQQQRPQQPISRLQGRPIPAPPKEDLRVFVRLDAEAPARDHSSYAIRTHIAAKVGIDLHRVPAAFKGNEVNYEAAVKDEIACQTGLTPISIRPSRHDSSDLPTLEQCANCLGPHSADFSKCPARPKRSHGVIRRLTKEENLVRQMGTQLFAQRKQQFERIDQPEQLERDSPRFSIP
ncbi:reverse transcriptase [Hirsutella rhossiliensis]